MKAFFSKLFILFILPAINVPVFGQSTVSKEVMQQVFEEIKTPYKYGLVMLPPDNTKKVDSPSIFRHKNNWYMSYIVFDGVGYETWLAKSDNLLQWQTLGRIMSFTNNTWDANQKAGYIALQDYVWGGSYEIEKYKGQYWLSYLGGETQGYEAGTLAIGMAHTGKPDEAKEWTRLEKAVLRPEDSDARWYDNETIFKSTVIQDKKKTIGYPFVMFYNARNRLSENTPSGKNAPAERIAMAVSKDMTHWKRYGDAPVIDHQTGISGDAFIAKIDDLWVMFYFGAFWKPGAFERFACSNDLVHWTDWEGEDLIAPSEPFDNLYAHKPFVIKHEGIVYHFYNAVNKEGQRGIAVATSKDVGKSSLQYPEK
jgi:predicted GH43/DUF377 family glycosyl hydrolase